MDSAFIYDRFVTGKNFVGRKLDCTSLANLIENGEAVAIYEPPKSGKTSLIQQTLFNMRLTGKQFVVSQVNLFNIRTIADFLLKFGAAVIKPAASTPADYSAIIEKYLGGTHFVFDEARFSSRDEVVSLNWDPDDNDIRQMLSLPRCLAQDRGVPYFVIVYEFQDIMMTEDYDKIFKVMEDVLKENSQDIPRKVSYLFSGSRVNAMKFIFEEKKYFFRQVEHLPLSVIDDNEIIEYIVKGLRLTGKVVERHLLQGACTLFRSNMWYMNNFMFISDSMTKGYLNEGIFVDSLKMILAVQEPKFKMMVDDLTDHQLSLMKAVLDGVVRFSASDVIEKYGLNSSANVRRVKDALKKKEIITFDSKDEPVILDPLFEYWLSKFYFERND